MLICAFCGVEPCCVTCRLSSFTDSTRREMGEGKQVVGALKPVRNGKLASEPVWPSGKAWLVSGGTSVRIRFGSPFSSKVVVCVSCYFFPHNYETLKWLSSLPTLMHKSF